MNQTTLQVNYESVQSIGGTGLRKPNKLSSQKFFWSGQSGPVFMMLLFIKNDQRYGKNAKPEDQSSGASESSNTGSGN